MSFFLQELLGICLKLRIYRRRELLNNKSYSLSYVQMKKKEWKYVFLTGLWYNLFVSGAKFISCNYWHGTMKGILTQRCGKNLLNVKEKKNYFKDKLLLTLMRLLFGLLNDDLADRSKVSPAINIWLKNLAAFIPFITGTFLSDNAHIKLTIFLRSFQN